MSQVTRSVCRERYTRPCPRPGPGRTQIYLNPVVVTYEGSGTRKTKKNIARENIGARITSRPNIR